MPDPPDALVVAPLAVAAVLAIAAVGKLRHPEQGPVSFVGLRVPLPLRRAWLVRAHPWAELGLAAGSVLAPTPLRWGFVSAAAALLLGYLALIARLVWRRERVSCACFGIGEHPVTGWTLGRNVALVLAGALAVIDLANPASPVARVLQHGGDGFLWLAIAVGIGVAAVAMDTVARPD
ncbi:MAG: MauE/DoxX family redox-associated membrane protein [Dermatophilaceae bacterium]